MSDLQGQGVSVCRGVQDLHVECDSSPAGYGSKKGLVMGNPKTEVKESGKSREAGRAMNPLNPEV